MESQTVCTGKPIVLSEDGYCNESPYTLVFEDNFDGNSLDTFKWRPITGVVRDMEHTIAQQWYTPANIKISDGTLKLITRRDTLINQCYSIYFNNAIQNRCEDFYFSAAQINTREKFSHGKIEISCKLPKAKGVASSFWTFGDPGSNEIDVFEFENEHKTTGKLDPDKLSRVQHMNSRTNYNENKYVEDCSSKYTGPDFSKDFHTFTLVWTPQKLEWYMDGNLKRTSTLFYTMLGQSVDCNNLQKGCQYILNRAFPMNPMYIIVDNIIQSKDNAPDNETSFPNYFEIDYIKFYKQEP